MANGDAQTQHLFELEFDGRSHLSELVGQILRRRYGRWEFSGCGLIRNCRNTKGRNSRGHTLGKTGTKETWDLLDECLRRQESIVFLRELLNQFLVLIQPETNF